MAGKRSDATRSADPLRAELGAAGADLPELATIDAAARRRLAQTVREARQRQRAALLASAEQALQHVPALLRGVVRRVLLG
jgi:hypothetical protein